MPDQLATMRSITKWAAHIDRPAEAPATVDAAFRAMLFGRMGPAAIEAPWDFFDATGEVAFSAIEPLPPSPAPDPASIDAAARLLKEARAPMIVVGGGAIDAADAVRELAELLGAPVMSFRSGHGIVSDEHDLGVNIAAGYRLWPDSDVLIGIGTRLELPSWRWKIRPANLKTIRIDIDPKEMERLPVEVGIVADANGGTRHLLAELRKVGAGGGGRRARVLAAKAAAAEDIEKIQPQMSFLKAIRAALPRDGIFVDEISQVGFTSWYGFPVYAPRTFITSGYQGTLGSGFPMALGVKVAKPDKVVVSITGDGGFMFAMPELATAVQYGIGLITVVFNNSSFGNVRRDQKAYFDGRIVGADLVNPDFMKLADAFGVRAWRATTPAQLQATLEKAMTESGPTLIEVPIERGTEKSPWRFIEPRAS
jgi:acetolactate synthase-1/2/3 large subunit